MKRDLISLKDLNRDEIEQILKLAAELKEKPGKDSSLKDKTIGLVFQKPSNRTRVSFEVGVRQLGGHCLYLGPEEINLGKRESTHDVAKTLSRYLNGIVARTFSNQDVVDLATHASVPVINGLSDLYHPCQAMADLMSIKERFGKLAGLTVAFVGDGNNVCHSLMIGCAKTGAHMKIATPPKYAPRKEIIDLALGFAKESGAKIEFTASAVDAVKGAHIVYADVWTSMGQEREAKKRLRDFKNYQITEDLTKLAVMDHAFMHCLPAHRGEEVTEGVIDGPHSIVFDQAENRLHAQKAILLFLFKGSKS